MVTTVQVRIYSLPNFPLHHWSGQYLFQTWMSVRQLTVLNTAWSASTPGARSPASVWQAMPTPLNPAIALVRIVAPMQPSLSFKTCSKFHKINELENAQVNKSGREYIQFTCPMLLASNKMWYSRY